MENEYVHVRRMFLHGRTFRSGIPISILHRESQLEAMEKAGQALRSGKKPEHLFLHGPTGTGKSTCLRHAVSRLRSTPGLVPVYVNCHESPSRSAVFSRVSEALGNAFSSKGFSGAEILGRIKELLEHENRCVLLALDDLEALLRNDGADLFHLIANANEERPLFAVVAAADGLGTLDALDAGIKSSFLFKPVKFDTYGTDEIARILSAVAERNLAPGSWDESALRRIAELAAGSGGNATFAIGLLYEAARSAEERNAERIGTSDAESVYARVLPVSRNGEVSSEEALILDILRMGERSSSEIYSVFLTRLDRSKRQIRNYLNTLVSKGLVKAEYVENHSALRPRIFRLRK